MTATPTATPTPAPIPTCETEVKAKDGGEILSGKEVEINCRILPEDVSDNFRFKYEVIKSGELSQTLNCNQNPCFYTIPDDGYGCYDFKCEVVAGE